MLELEDTPNALLEMIGMPAELLESVSGDSPVEARLNCDCTMLLYAACSWASSTAPEAAVMMFATPVNEVAQVAPVLAAHETSIHTLGAGVTHDTDGTEDNMQLLGPQHPAR